MREDMDKVIVERPRIGSRLPSRKKGYRKYLQKTGLENLPKREPLPGRWRGRERFLNEHLGPMRRFLRSRVGRPWNKVHQELCAHVSFDNAVQKHVLTHIFDFVHRYVEIRDGRIMEQHRWFRRSSVLPPGTMYVCPNTGLLKVVCPKKRTHSPRRIQFGAGTQYHWRDNAWWEVRVRKPPGDPGELWDVWLERPLARLRETDLQNAYGGKLTATSKRLLSRGEVRQLYRDLRRKRSSDGTDCSKPQR